MEVACSDTVHAWRQLCPCGTRQGLAAVLRDAARLLAGPFFSAGLQLHRCVSHWPQLAAQVQVWLLWCRLEGAWQIQLALDAVLPLPEQGASLRSLLAADWPPACPDASSSIQVLVAPSSRADPGQHDWGPPTEHRSGHAGQRLLVYSPAEQASSQPPQQQQPVWELAQDSQASLPGRVSVQQYVGGLQGVRGSLNIHVRRLAEQQSPAAEMQAYCLLQVVPWQMQLQLSSLRQNLHLQVSCL